MTAVKEVDMVIVRGLSIRRGAPKGTGIFAQFLAAFGYMEVAGCLCKEYGENFMQELSHLFPGEIVLLKEYEYFRWENGRSVRVVPQKAPENGGQEDIPTN